MAYDSLLPAYLGLGLASARPSAPTPAPGTLEFFYATDTTTLSLWNGTAWVTIGGGGLTPIPNLELLANISGGSADPSGTTVSALLDAVFGTTQGAVLYRGASLWAALAPGTSGQVLTTGGASANPRWAAGGGGSSPTIAQKTFARTASTSTTATLGASPTPGNYMVAILSGAAANSSGAVPSFAPPAGWGEIMNLGFQGFEQFGVYVREVQSGDGTSYTFTSGLAEFNVAIYETTALTNITYIMGTPTFSGTGATTVTGSPVGQYDPAVLRIYTMEQDNVQTSVTSGSMQFVVDNFYGNDGNNHSAVIGQISPITYFGSVITDWAGTVARPGDMQVTLWG